MGGTPDGPEKTAEQLAMETMQRRRLNEETASSERRLKAMARGKLGKQSLLSQPMQAPEAPSGPTVTKGYIRTADGLVKSKLKGRAGIDARRSATAGGVVGADKKSILVGGVVDADKKSILAGAVGGKSSKKKKLFGGIF